MQRLRRWMLPALTVISVLLSVTLPMQISRWTDQSAFAAVHTAPLGEEDRYPPSASMEEKLVLLWSTITEPNLQMTSASQSIPVEREEIARQMAPFVKDSVTTLIDCGVLPPEVNEESFRLTAATRVVYFQKDTGRMLSTLYLSCDSENRCHLWFVMDEETQHILWLECLMPEADFSALDAEQIGNAFFQELGLSAYTTEQGTQSALFCLPDAEKLLYHVGIEQIPSRLSISPAGFSKSPEGTAALTSGPRSIGQTGYSRMYR